MFDYVDKIRERNDKLLAQWGIDEDDFVLFSLLFLLILVLLTIFFVWGWLTLLCLVVGIVFICLFICFDGHDGYVSQICSIFLGIFCLTAYVLGWLLLFVVSFFLLKEKTERGK